MTNDDPKQVKVKKMSHTPRFVVACIGSGRLIGPPPSQFLRQQVAFSFGEYLRQAASRTGEWRQVPFCRSDIVDTNACCLIRPWDDNESSSFADGSSFAGISDNLKLAMEYVGAKIEDLVIVGPGVNMVPGQFRSDNGPFLQHERGMPASKTLRYLNPTERDLDFVWRFHIGIGAGAGSTKDARDGYGMRPMYSKDQLNVEDSVFPGLLDIVQKLMFGGRTVTAGHAHKMPTSLAGEKRFMRVPLDFDRQNYGGGKKASKYANNLLSTLRK